MSQRNKLTQEERIELESVAEAMRAERAQRTYEDFFVDVGGYAIIQTPEGDYYTVEEIYQFFKARIADEKK